MMALPLDRLTPVPLADMLAEAPLMTRTDRKYVLTRQSCALWLGALPATTRILDIDGTRDPGYESVYFDTDDLLTFRLAVQQRRRRLKLRTRSYVDSHDTFLEAKTRQGDDTTVKERVDYAWESRSRLTAGGRSYAAEALAAVGQAPSRAAELGITLTTRYRRSTLLPAPGVRVTLDQGLTCSLPDGRTVAWPDVVIVETKTDGAASPIDRSLWHAGHRPTAISKYATGLAALRPELPHNRWARLLRDRLNSPVTPRTVEDLPCAAV